MIIEDTQIKVIFTVRQMQSLATILNRVNNATREKTKRVNLIDVNRGMLDDSFLIEHELRNLLDFSAALEDS